ncbi:cytochrome P450 [Paraliobacillus ryukyuensis]|uniref:cytochrome P450 n=1 Tax=Paraliobacillus ryukyuensis TaxID=200904 RepID=UPI002119B687|nr:cytochrome P450 [Paraliobacillus ryukyuensis]
MTMMKKMPKESGIDHTLALLKEGYPFLFNRRQEVDSTIFKTRILGQQAIALSGKEAASLFYDNEKFRRSDAAPKRIQKTLFGEGGVQSLDGEAHHHRKAMFMTLMSRDGLNEMYEIIDKELTAANQNWKKENHIVLDKEIQKLLTKAACQWVGVPLPDKEINQRTEQLADMFESAASIGPKHWKGRKSRKDGEEWIISLVRQVRNNEMAVDEDRALYTFSWHRDLDGNLLNEKIVAVELLNLLRPIVAISAYINFLVLALYEHPEERENLKNTDNENRFEWFCQEVRRYYPFFPFAAARVKRDFIWNGFTFKEGTLTLLDLYGTNHDPNEWSEPNQFKPDRFQEWKGSPFDFIPQGGGEFNLGHRCAGEWMTLGVMKRCLSFFVHMDFELPEQDLSYSMTEMPSKPKSKIIMQVH